MTLFQRITATFTGSVSALVAQVENHEAVVEAALKDSRAASAKARVRLARLQKDTEGLRRKLQELRQAEAAWAQRAVASAETDRAAALACVKRRNACRDQIAQTATMLARTEEVEREVLASVERIESRLGELGQQRNMMRSRHSAADAMRVIQRIEGSAGQGIEDIFDRWEMRITECEYESGAARPADALEHAFLTQESEEALSADLAALLETQPTAKTE